MFCGCTKKSQLGNHAILLALFLNELERVFLTGCLSDSPPTLVRFTSGILGFGKVPFTETYSVKGKLIIDVSISDENVMVVSLNETVYVKHPFVVDGDFTNESTDWLINNMLNGTELPIHNSDYPELLKSDALLYPWECYWDGREISLFLNFANEFDYYLKKKNFKTGTEINVVVIVTLYFTFIFLIFFLFFYGTSE